MQAIKATILSTKIIGGSHIKAAARRGIAIEELPFIHTEPVRSAEVENKIRELSTQTATVIFTSANAVYAVREHLPCIPRWRIFCIGYKTKNVVAETFGAGCILGTADTGQLLAQVILKQRPQGQFVFFCGNKRREYLPVKLRFHGIPPEEIVVYTTTEKRQLISKPYDGIVFFSPSAVRSFFSANRLTNKPVIFAIGQTTANEIRFFSLLPVITPKHPDMEEVISLIIEQYKNKKTFK